MRLLVIKRVPRSCSPAETTTATATRSRRIGNAVSARRFRSQLASAAPDSYVEDMQARLQLGLLHAEGKGLAPNELVFAYIWLDWVAKRGAYGNEAAKQVRDVLAAQMTSEQIEEANTREKVLK